MILRIRMVRRVTPKAINVVLGDWPYRVCWLPRFAIRGGDEVEAGQRNIEIALRDDIAEQKGIGREVVAEDYGEMDF
jgi:hypothetical protein